MEHGKPPRLVPTEELARYFSRKRIAHAALGSLDLAFGRGNDQYRLYEYPAPADDETMGLFCEWHTGDFFEVDSGPHVAIGLRGPLPDDPHRGRGIAIGILASRWDDPQEPGRTVPLFSGCPEPPGGPAFFIEDFSRNDGHTPIPEWQISPGRPLPLLAGHGVYRIDIHVSASHAWAGVWSVTTRAAANGGARREYLFLDQVACSDEAPGFSGDPSRPCPQLAADRGRGNAFIGHGFANPETRSRMEHIYLAHWKTC